MLINFNVILLRKVTQSIRKATLRIFIFLCVTLRFLANLRVIVNTQ